jgi:hypothetical protein
MSKLFELLPLADLRAVFEISPFDQDVQPLDVGARIDSLMIELPYGGHLSFSKLEVLDFDGRRVTAAMVREVVHSPRHPSSLLDWREDPMAESGFDGDFSTQPHYRIYFKKPIDVKILRIRNKLGRWGIRLLPVQIKAYENGHLKWQHRNISRETLNRRLLSWISLAFKLGETGAIARDAFVDAALALSLLDYSEITCGSHDAAKAFQAIQAKAIELALSTSEVQPRIAANFLLSLAPRSAEGISQLSLDVWATACAILLKHGLMGKEFALFLASWNGLYETPDDLFLLETRVCEMYKGIGGIGTPSISRHGWFVSQLTIRSEEFAGKARDVVDHLTDLGYASFLSYGSLLGARRNGAFIPYDDDLDIHVVLPGVTLDTLGAAMARLAEKLVERNFRCRYSADLKIIQVDVASDLKQGMDIFPIIDGPTSDLVYAHHARMEMHPLEKSVLGEFGQTELEGKIFPAPENVDAFLAWRYGDDWETPNRYFEMSWIFNR